MLNTHNIIKKYYDCWLNNDRDGARSFLADDLKFRSPQDSFDNADDFISTCWKFAEGFDRMDYLHEIYSEKGGYIVYSGGDFCCGELIIIRDSKISEIYVTFEPTR